MSDTARMRKPYTLIKHSKNILNTYLIFFNSQAHALLEKKEVCMNLNSFSIFNYLIFKLNSYFVVHSACKSVSSLLSEFV